MRYLTILLLFVGCSETMETAPYFDEFQQEARNRGIFVSQPTVKLMGTLKNNYGAYWDGSVIRVDTTSLVWKLHPIETMMHEYGHACLNRKHDNNRLSNGMYRSVMGNYSNAMLSGWTTYDSIQYRRDYYFDELFNKNTPEPEWAK